MPEWLKGQLRMAGLVLGALVIAGALFGTPYFGGDYWCAVPLRFGESGCRVYNRCEYHGLQGVRVLHGEQCGGGLVRLLPFAWR
jgi:hypothetical protein